MKNTFTVCDSRTFPCLLLNIRNNFSFTVLSVQVTLTLSILNFLKWTDPTFCLRVPLIIYMGSNWKVNSVGHKNSSPKINANRIATSRPKFIMESPVKHRSIAQFN